MAAPSVPPSHAWGFLPRDQFQQLPPHPSSTVAGHPHCRAVASYDTTGAVQHFVLPLDRTKPSTMAHQGTYCAVSGRTAPCVATFVSPADRCAFSFFVACNHQVETEQASDSDSDNSHSYGSDDPPDTQNDDDENLATALLTEDIGYNPIQGNLVIVKHTVVDDLPARVMEADMLDVLVEDFPVLHGLVFRYIVGDWEDESRQFLPSPYSFQRRRVKRNASA
ncbi:hypothetical protein C8F01DRAFT_1081516 [Mycena amicta]|nr:hypothetical protein C8F01DRAFT_1081516 [Mycena amicta]